MFDELVVGINLDTLNDYQTEDLRHYAETYSHSSYTKLLRVVSERIGHLTDIRNGMIEATVDSHMTDDAVNIAALGRFIAAWYTFQENIVNVRMKAVNNGR